MVLGALACLARGYSPAVGRGGDVLVHLIPEQLQPAPGAPLAHPAAPRNDALSVKRNAPPQATGRNLRQRPGIVAPLLNLFKRLASKALELSSANVTL